MRATLTNLAHSGKTTDEVIRDQIPNIPQNTDLVMLTIGCNDAKFSKAIERCFAAGFRSAPMCRDSIQYAKDQFSDIIDNTTVILSDLENKLPSTSQVVLVGYPLLSVSTDPTIY